VELVDPSWFRTEKRWQQLQDALARERGQASAGPAPAHPYFGTVGAVALDSPGQLAAGTSTGGMANTRGGRAGGAPLGGAGPPPAATVAPSCLARTAASPCRSTPAACTGDGSAPTGCRTWRCSTSHCPCPEPLRRGPAGAGTAPGRVRSSSRTAPRAPPGPET